MSKELFSISICRPSSIAIRKVKLTEIVMSSLGNVIRTSQLLYNHKWMLCNNLPTAVQFHLAGNVIAKPPGFSLLTLLLLSRFPNVGFVVLELWKEECSTHVSSWGWIKRKNTFQNIYWIFLWNFRGIKKMNRVSWRDPTSLARDIAVRSVIGLHKSHHVSDVICASVL